MVLGVILVLIDHIRDSDLTDICDYAFIRILHPDYITPCLVTVLLLPLLLILLLLLLLAPRVQVYLRPDRSDHRQKTQKTSGWIGIRFLKMSGFCCS